MEVLGMAGMLWKNIFASKMCMSITERNKENDIYRPRNICTGYTVVTENDRRVLCIYMSNLNPYNLWILNHRHLMIILQILLQPIFFLILD